MKKDGIEKDELAQEKNKFLANISHEIRTPLNGILGLSLQLKKENLSEPVMKMVDDMCLLSHQLSLLVNNIFDCANLGFSNLELDDINFHFNSEISALLVLFQKKCEEKNLSFQVERDPNIPEYLKGDPARMLQLINNFIGIAFKFTESGKITFKMELLAAHGQENEIKFTIIDTGIGITEIEEQSIWALFTPLDNINSRVLDGTGFELSLSKQLAELMGGTVGFKKGEDNEYIFWFTVKLKNGINPGELSSKCYNKILLVEDNIINQKIAQFSLQNNGFEVDIAENGKVAVEKFTQNHYDLILMDIQMPIMDGITAATNIRQIEVEQKTTKPTQIVALTANAVGEDRQRCLQAGMNGYISKPFNLDKFPIYISQFTGHR